MSVSNSLENMHFFQSEMRGRKIPGLEAYVKQAKATYDQNLETYSVVVVRKPLGKLLVCFMLSLHASLIFFRNSLRVSKRF